MNNEEKILQVLSQLQGDIVKMREEMNERFADVNERLDKVDERFDKVNERFDKVDERFADVNERLDTIDNNIKYTWQDVAMIEKRIVRHEKEFHNVG